MKMLRNPSAAQSIGWVVLACLVLIPATSTAGTGAPRLARCYFRFLLCDQVMGQATQIVKGEPKKDQDQIRRALEGWRDRKIAQIRGELDSAYGENAHAMFSQFEEDFVQAEQAGDTAYLLRMGRDLRLRPVPRDYGTFRQAVVEQLLKSDLDEASRLLSETQTWLDVRRKVDKAPPFELWLARDETAAPAEQLAGADEIDVLSYAEPEMGDWIPEEEEEGSSLDTYSAMHKDRRDRILAEAQAGMQQVAEERRAAEEEYAARKLAEAEKEAEAIKRHAQELADVEKEALEQRKNSWSARFKEIVKATVTAAGGAFLGDVGAEAGKRAADAVFGK